MDRKEIVRRYKEALRAGVLCLSLLLLPTRGATAQEPVAIPRGALTFEQTREAEALRFVPTDRAVAWLTGDTLLVSHFEAYGTGLRFFVNCFGSGFFKVPVAGGQAVAAGRPFCQLDKSLTASPDGASVLFFGEPAYTRDGTAAVRTAGAPLLRLHLASWTLDTLRIACGSGAKDVALSGGGRLAWTGPCAGGKDGIYVAALAGGDTQRAGGPEGVDAHDPAWSPGGTSIAFSAGANPLPGRWEVIGAEPGALIVIDPSGVRPLGVAGEAPAWSPDGASIAFLGTAEVGRDQLPGGPGIDLIRANGTDRRSLFRNDLETTYPEWFYGPWPTDVRDGKAFGPLVWSPDGRWLAFSRQFEDGASLWRVEVGSGRLERLTTPDTGKE